MLALNRSWIALVVLSSLAAACRPAPAAEENPLPIAAVVDSVGLEAYGPVAAISPDGAYAAYSVSIAHVHQLRLLSLKTFSVRTLTNPPDAASAPAWCPAGKSLAFIMRRGGQSRLWTWSVDSGELKQISRAPVANLPPWFRPQWTPDCQSIVVALETPFVAAAMAAAGPVPTPHAEVSVFRTNRPNSPQQLPSERPAFTDGVALVDVGSGEVRKLFSGQVEGYQLDSSGMQLAVLERMPRPNPHAFHIANRLQILDLRSGRSKIVSSTVTTQDGRFTWSPDGRELAWVQDYAPEIGPAYLASAVTGSVRRIQASTDAQFAMRVVEGKPVLWDGNSKHFFLITGQHLWIGTTHNAASRRLTHPGEWEVIELVAGTRPGSAASSDNYKSVLASVINRKTMQQGFARINLQSGALSLLISSEGHLTGPANKAAVSPDGKQVLYPAEAVDQPPALWLSDLEFRSPRRAVVLNPALQNNVFGKSRLVEWRNSRGNTLQGVLLMPRNCRPDHRCPLIVNIYAMAGTGRRKGVFGTLDDGTGQLYATRGYAVFSPDTQLRTNTPAADLVEDVGAGLDAVLRMGVFDESRIAVEGASYGAYNAMVLITHDPRYRTAVSVAGFSEIATATYGNAGQGSMQAGWAEGPQGRMGGSPWQSPELRRTYIDNSPFWELHKINEKVGVLLIHGAQDDTVPPFASMMTFQGLSRLGREAELVIYPDENHGFLKRENRMTLVGRKLAWFDDHLDLMRDERGHLLFDGERPRSGSSAGSRSSTTR